MKNIKLSERDIAITFRNVVNAEKFDDSSHGMSHCLKAVDFLCELTNEFWFIEIKDPQDASIPAIHRQTSIKEFTKGLHTEDYFKIKLAGKLKDSVYYLHLAKRLPDKPVKYLVLVGLSPMDPALLVTAQDRLQKACCDPSPKTFWKRRYSVLFLNIDSWNKFFPNCHVTRQSISKSKKL